jgi:hypothetical protein
MEELNAILLNTLLAKHGSMPMQRDHFWELPLYFSSGILPIAISDPAVPLLGAAARRGPLPRTARTSACSSSPRCCRWAQLIFVKDEDGLYDKDPKRHADAPQPRKITLAELLAPTCPDQHPRRRAVPRLATARTSSASRSSTGSSPAC